MAVGAGAAVASTAQPTPVPGGVYTDTQARQGGVLYAAHCAQCHGQDLAGVEQAPALAGAAFREKWKGATLDRLFDRVVSMPPAQPNSLSGNQYADILAYLLSANALPAGTAALAADRSALANVVFNAAPLALAGPARREPERCRSRTGASGAPRPGRRGCHPWSGRPMAATSPARATRRSTRSTSTTSRNCRSPGG